MKKNSNVVDVGARWDNRRQGWQGPCCVEPNAEEFCAQGLFAFSFKCVRMDVYFWCWDLTAVIIFLLFRPKGRRLMQFERSCCRMHCFAGAVLYEAAPIFKSQLRCCHGRGIPLRKSICNWPAHPGPSGPIRAHPGPCGPIRAHPGPSGPILSFSWIEPLLEFSNFADELIAAVPSCLIEGCVLFDRTSCPVFFSLKWHPLICLPWTQSAELTPGTRARNELTWCLAASMLKASKDSKAFGIEMSIQSFFGTISIHSPHRLQISSHDQSHGSHGSMEHDGTYLDEGLSREPRREHLGSQRHRQKFQWFQYIYSIYIYIFQWRFQWRFQWFRRGQIVQIAQIAPWRSTSFLGRCRQSLLPSPAQ